MADAVSRRPAPSSVCTSMVSDVSSSAVSTWSPSADRLLHRMSSTRRCTWLDRRPRPALQARPHPLPPPPTASESPAGSGSRRYPAPGFAGTSRSTATRSSQAAQCPSGIVLWLSASANFNGVLYRLRNLLRFPTSGGLFMDDRIPERYVGSDGELDDDFYGLWSPINRARSHPNPARRRSLHVTS